MSLVINFWVYIPMILYDKELTMPTLQVKYILCKILVSGSLLEKDSFQ